MYYFVGRFIGNWYVDYRFIVLWYVVADLVDFNIYVEWNRWISDCSRGSGSGAVFVVELPGIFGI